MLDVCNLNVTGRHGRVLLHDVSFSLPPGMLLAVVGPNGAGKSTLGKTLAGLIRPHSGRILLDNRPLNSLDRKARARQVAWLPQSVTPVPCSVFDAVLLGRRPHMAWLPSAQDRRCTAAMLQELRLDHLSASCVTGLSGGELQKTLIARALVQEAPVLVLDEPVNHLDIRNQVEILQTVRTLTRTRQMRSLVVLHNLSFALRYADAVLLLHQGQSLFLGPPTDLQAQTLSTAYGIAVRLQDVDGIRYALV
ncbi:ABC transporter ATP-binding protein [uncultured Desulfovibrio sp.]|uniref:ABC transporter ATP-binding protein n=1 Tax=Desulfovibrio legallii TaxID=571438 RepID=UPI001AA2574C|nr:ABC transporter ATP-binding protein [uncultured Desulfovibrio sp.]CAI3223093.1 ATPase [Desulfovibrio diazotrophicus]VVU42800.1 ATPase [Desulfovibrio diazotrophicus]